MHKTAGTFSRISALGCCCVVGLTDAHTQPTNQSKIKKALKKKYQQ